MNDCIDYYQKAREARQKILIWGGDQRVDGGGTKDFLDGGGRPPWGGQGSDGIPPILDNPASALPHKFCSQYRSGVKYLVTDSPTPPKSCKKYGNQGVK